MIWLLITQANDREVIHYGFHNSTLPSRTFEPPSLGTLHLNHTPILVWSELDLPIIFGVIWFQVQRFSLFCCLTEFNLPSQWKCPLKHRSRIGDQNIQIGIRKLQSPNYMESESKLELEANNKVKSQNDLNLWTNKIGFHLRQGFVVLVD